MESARAYAQLHIRRALVGARSKRGCAISMVVLTLSARTREPFPFSRFPRCARAKRAGPFCCRAAILGHCAHFRPRRRSWCCVYALPLRRCSRAHTRTCATRGCGRRAQVYGAFCGSSGTGQGDCEMLGT